MTGRPPGARLPAFRTVALARVQLLGEDGRPIRALLARPDGAVPATGLAGVSPGEKLTAIARRGDVTASLVLTAVAP